ncbi:hypothetical protein [Mucilaginibacter aquariorum]|uniref:Uncharacterized protein n=1 Tax=Mucilaginibacter aquariorum TaxID=2967225 RepID=A0ABT1T169_9SPHI|nr:hypothetical protein [Mucilaginibacter aquariorum]MCQ6957728.1 hypothetical protein [Mucilaginibacter aquariorum]
MNAHKLAEILLKGKDFPVIIPSNSNGVNAELIANIYVLQNVESPFEYSIFLEGRCANENPIINVKD